MVPLNPAEPHIRIAHSIQEQIMVSAFTEHELKILLFILRLSWGCGKRSAYIPKQRDFQMVGVREVHIKAKLDYLIDSKVIIREGSYYEFNQDFEAWRISRAREYNQQKLTELVRLNLVVVDQELKNPDEIVASQLTKNVSKLTNSVRPNLLKREETTYQKGKFLEPDTASSKERIKESDKEKTDDLKQSSSTLSEVVRGQNAALLGKEQGGAVPQEKESHGAALASPGFSDDSPGADRGKIADIVGSYENAFGPIVPTIAEGLRGICHDYPAQWVLIALKKACAAHAKRRINKPIKYITSILESYRTEGLPTASVPPRQVKGEAPLHLLKGMEE